MYVLRRAAVRAITQQPTRQLSTLRPSTRVTPLSTQSTSLYRSFHQARIWRAEEEKKSAAEAGAASPAEAQTSGETVTTEPSQAEQEIKEESIATPDVADAAQQASKQQQHHEAAYDAVSESSGTTSAPTGQAEAPAQRVDSASEGIAEKAKQFASSVSETYQTATRAASQTARQAFESTASSNQNAQRSSYPPLEKTQRPARNLEDRQPSRILYIGNLFFEVTAPQLEAEFAKFGEVTNSRVVTDSRGLSKGFAYVEFGNQDAADRAVRELDQKVFQGRRMAVQYHVRRERAGVAGRRERTANQPSKTLFIGNMSYQMSDRDLNDLFREIRNVLDVRVAIDRRSGQPRGFAHADFIDVASAQKAKEHLEQKVVYGRQLRVDFSASSSGRPAEGGREEGGY